MWAIHISDGFLSAPWWVGGWVVAAGLFFLGAWRVRDEDLPRIALLTAAFFIASLIHVPVPGGPRTHLLLTGLLGVILGRHAAVAVPIGLFLQAALFMHGGYTSLGINSCIMTAPALASWLLFSGLKRLSTRNTDWFRQGILLVSWMLFLISLVYAVTLLVSNPWREVERLDFTQANRLAFHPVTIGCALMLAVAGAHFLRRLASGPSFVEGFFVGQLAVLLTLVLNSVALLMGGEADWHALVLITCIIHLPLAVLEGVVVGSTVAFLLRVKPELLLGTDRVAASFSEGEVELAPADAVPCTGPLASRTVLFLLAGCFLFASPRPVQAHGMDAWVNVDVQARKVSVRSWFDGGEPPTGAKVTVIRPDESILLQESLDDQGQFTFSYEKIEPLRIVISARGGHRKEVVVTEAMLLGSAPPATVPAGISMRDVVLGITSLLALAAFVLSVRNMQKLRVPVNTLLPAPAPAPTSPSLGKDTLTKMSKPLTDIQMASDETVRIPPEKKPPEDRSGGPLPPK